MLTAMKNEVIVEIEDARPSESKTGILIPKAQYSELPWVGHVRHIGEGVHDLKVGDKVIYEDKQPQGFKHDGRKLLRLKHSQVLAVLYE